MKKCSKKLRSCLGETLVEAMAAILVFTLASILLFTMVNSASRINKEAMESDAAIYSDLLVAEKKIGAGSPGEVTLVVNGTEQETYSVRVYQSAPGSLYSYSLDK